MKIEDLDNREVVEGNEYFCIRVKKTGGFDFLKRGFAFILEAEGVVMVYATKACLLKIIEAVTETPGWLADVKPISEYAFFESWKIAEFRKMIPCLKAKRYIRKPSARKGRGEPKQ